MRRCGRPSLARCSGTAAGPKWLLAATTTAPHQPAWMTRSPSASTPRSTAQAAPGPREARCSLPRSGEVWRRRRPCCSSLALCCSNAQVVCTSRRAAEAWVPCARAHAGESGCAGFSGAGRLGRQGAGRRHGRSAARRGAAARWQGPAAGRGSAGGHAATRGPGSAAGHGRWTAGHGRWLAVPVRRSGVWQVGCGGWAGTPRFGQSYPKLSIRL